MLYASRLATKVAQLPHAWGIRSISTFLSTLARTQQAARAISAAQKALQAAHSVHIGKEGTGMGQSTAVSSGRFFASIPYFPWMSYPLKC